MNNLRLTVWILDVAKRLITGFVDSRSWFLLLFVEKGDVGLKLSSGEVI